MMCPAPLGTKVHSHELRGPTSPYKLGKSGQGFHLLSNDQVVMRTIQGSKEKKCFPGIPASGQAGDIDEKATRASSLSGSLREQQRRKMQREAENSGARRGVTWLLRAMRFANHSRQLSLP